MNSHHTTCTIDTSADVGVELDADVAIGADGEAASSSSASRVLDACSE